MDNACKCAPQLVVWHRGQSYMLTIAVRLLHCFCKSIKTSWLLKWWHKHIEHLVCYEKVAKCQLTPDGTQTQQFVDTIVLWDQIESYICSAIESTNIIIWLYESICCCFFQLKQSAQRMPRHMQCPLSSSPISSFLHLSYFKLIKYWFKILHTL